MASLVWYLNWASEQVCSPFASEGLMPAPSGRFTVAVFRYELAIGSFGSKGMPMTSITGFGEPVALSTLTFSVGSNGTLSQTSPENGAVTVDVSLAHSYEST